MRTTSRTRTFVSTLLLSIAVALTAVASGVHFTKAGVSFVADHNNLTLTASGQISGLGNGAIVSLSATANPTTTCTNGGGTQAPGQNPGSITVTGATALPDANGTNGSRPFSVTSNPPTQPTSGKAGGCPNNSWTATIDDLAFTSATLTFQQPDKNGNLVTVLTQSYTFNPPL